MAEIPTEWLHEESYGPQEVGRLFKVDSRTVTQWAKSGIIGFFRTPSGMRRFPECEVKRLMRGDNPPEFLKELADQDTAKYREKWEGGWKRNSTVLTREEREAGA